MARSKHGTLSAADRFDRRKGRQGRPASPYRRSAGRAAQRRLAIAEGV